MIESLGGFRLKLRGAAGEGIAISQIRTADSRRMGTRFRSGQPRAAHPDPDPGTAPYRDARAARPVCGPCAASAPRHPARGAPRGAAPLGPDLLLRRRRPESELSMRSRRSSSATRSSSRRRSSRSTSRSARATANPSRSAASSASLASITARSRAISARCSPAAPDGSGSSNTSPKLAQPELEVQTPSGRGVSDRATQPQPLQTREWTPNKVVDDVLGLSALASDVLADPRTCWDCRRWRAMFWPTPARAEMAATHWPGCSGSRSLAALPDTRM